MSFSHSYLLIVILALSVGCDKVDQPIRPEINLDTTIYPGNWDTYPAPVWTQNLNTDRNVMLEDYSGHKCYTCPAAATEAQLIEAANPDRVFVATIHAGPGGVTINQQTNINCGTPANPLNKYCTELFCNEGIAYGQGFSSGYGFFANPMGTVNRTTPTGTSMFDLYVNWDNRVNNILNENELKVNIQAQSNYYASTNGVYLHTEIEFLSDLQGQYNTVVYVIENEIIDWQLDGSSDIEDYHHHNVLVDCIDDQPWGQSISKSNLGDKVNFDYSYKLPSGKTNDDYHLLIYVYDLATYEILQVIKHEL